MRNELQQHKKSDKIKWIATALAVVMLGVGVTAAITKGFKDWNPYGWFDKKTEQPETPDNGGAVTGDVVENGVKLARASIAPVDYAANGISPVAEKAYTFTATISPEVVTNKKVDWSVVFVNPESEWAKGKKATDYVSVTPTADGALTANVACLQAFGEKIQVIVASRVNPKINAICTIDYVKRITSISHDFGTFSLPAEMTVTPDVSYGIGTVQGTVSLADCTFSLTQDFKNRLEERMEDIGGMRELFDYTVPDVDLISFPDISVFSGDDDLTAWVYYPEFYNAFLNVVSEFVALKGQSIEGKTADIYDATFSYRYSYNGTLISSGTFVDDSHLFNVDNLEILPTSITLNHTTIFF